MEAERGSKEPPAAAGDGASSPTGRPAAADPETTDPPTAASAEATERPADSAPAPDEAAAAEVERDFDVLLDETRQERDSYLELAQRTRADFENYRKRMAAETQAAATRGKSELAVEMIGVLDNLERAIEAAGLDPAAVLDGIPADGAGALEQGCLLTYRDSVAALGRVGVEPYAPQGEPFDPAWHEALQARPQEGAEAGVIVEVLQKGYRMGETVLRPARVVVSE